MRRDGAAAIPGMEGAGVIEAIDIDDPTGLRVGDRVAWVMQPGAYAQHVALPSRALVPVPNEIDLQTAAAAILQGLTAQYLVTDSATVGAGDTVLVHAGAGGVGRLLAQLVVAAGGRVLATVSSEEKATVARQAGAAEVIRYDAIDFADAARSLTGGRGVDVVYDAVNRRTFHGSLRALRCRGTLVLYGEASGQVDPIPPKLLQRAGSVKLTYPSLAHLRDELLERARRLFVALTDGALALQVTTYPLAAAAETHRALERRQTTGKVVLVM
jgi:NADPH2:quinone reductase